jgi:hypothetical protein
MLAQFLENQAGDPRPPPASTIGSKIRASRSAETHNLTIIDRRVLVR